MLNKFFFIAIFLMQSLPTLFNMAVAQDVTGTPGVEMADALRADGKIYVVVLVVMIVFTFFSVYLILTDRHVKKLEKEMREFKKLKK